MTNNRIACLAFAGFICASFPALAEDAISHPASKTIGASSSEMVASLGVINADEPVTFEITRLALATTVRFGESWTTGKGRVAKLNVSLRVALVARLAAIGG